MPKSPDTRRLRVYEEKISKRYLMRILESLNDAPLAPVRAAFEKLGLDYDRVRREPEIAWDDLYVLLHHLNQDDCFPGIGLRFGMARSLLDLGVAGYAMLSCKDLRMAMGVIDTFDTLSNRTAELTITEDGRWCVVHLRINPECAHMAVVLNEEEITGTWRVLCSLLHPEPNPADLHVEVTHDEPGYSELYHELMGFTPEFSKPETTFAFPKSWLDMPVPTADPAVREISEAQCELILQEMTPADEFVDNVRRLLLGVSKLRSLRVDDIAKALLISKRTLERRLHDRGTSFRKVANEVRMQLAGEYLSSGYLSIKEVAFLLGYSQPATFHRAFRSWHGVTPKEYQQARR